MLERQSLKLRLNIWIKTKNHPYILRWQLYLSELESFLFCDVVQSLECRVVSTDRRKSQASRIALSGTVISGLPSVKTKGRSRPWLNIQQPKTERLGHETISSLILVGIFLIISTVSCVLEGKSSLKHFSNTMAGYASTNQLVGGKSTEAGQAKR